MIPVTFPASETTYPNPPNPWRTRAAGGSHRYPAPGGGCSAPGGGIARLAHGHELLEAQRPTLVRVEALQGHGDIHVAELDPQGPIEEDLHLLAAHHPVPVLVELLPLLRQLLYLWARQVPHAANGEQVVVCGLGTLWDGLQAGGIGLATLADAAAEDPVDDELQEQNNAEAEDSTTRGKVIPAAIRIGGLVRAGGPGCGGSRSALGS